MRSIAVRARFALIAAAFGCALSGVGTASATGPVFAVVPDDSAALLSTPAVTFTALGTLTGSDSTAAAALAQEPLGAHAVAIALRHIGVPYVWGGASPSGFDCSGLAMYVYGLLGISLPHYTGAQINMGFPVSSLDQVQPGDLLFFRPQGNGDPGHEGIYIGRGLMVHAPQSGDYVRVSVLDFSRMANFMGAVRPY